MRVDARTTAQRYDALVALAGVGARGAFAWPERGPVRLSLSIDVIATLPVVHVAFSATGDPAWRSPPVALTTSLGLEWSPAS
jgi:hypothetical protein